MRCSVKLVTTRTRAGLLCSRSSRSASMPSMPGILTSIRITSGRSSTARADALVAVGGLADDLDVVLDLQEGPQAPRTTWWSSTSRTRIAWTLGSSATGHLHLDRRCPRRAPTRLLSAAADGVGAVPHGDQAEVAAGPADRGGVEAAAVVA